MRVWKTGFLDIAGGNTHLHNSLEDNVAISIKITITFPFITKSVTSRSLFQQIHKTSYRVIEYSIFIAKR